MDPGERVVGLMRIIKDTLDDTHDDAECRRSVFESHS